MSDEYASRYLFTLLKLAEMGAHRRTAKISTEYLARSLILLNRRLHVILLNLTAWVGSRERQHLRVV